MAQSVKLNDDVMEVVRREAALQSRSVAGQITHWLRIGRAIEQLGNFDYRRVRAALEASLAPEELTVEEHWVWLSEFGARMSEPGKTEEDTFAKRRRMGLGVGLNQSGDIVQRAVGRGTPPWCWSPAVIRKTSNRRHEARVRQYP